MRAIARMRRDHAASVDPHDCPSRSLGRLAGVVRDNRTATPATIQAILVEDGEDRKAAARLVGDLVEFEQGGLGDGPAAVAAVERTRRAGGMRRLEARWDGLARSFDLHDPAARDAAREILDEANVALAPAGSVRLSDVAPAVQRFLWPGRIPVGSITVLAGDGGVGKSLVSLDLAARATRGSPWPDGAANTGGPAEVLMVGCEDGIEETVVPRLEAAAADRSKVHMLELDSLTDLAALRSFLRRRVNARLVVIDPISAYMGSLDSWKAAEVRRCLRPLAELAAAHQVAVMLVAHLNKGTEKTKAAHRVDGSTAFVNAARSVLLVEPDKADRSRRIVAPIKNNAGPDTTGLAYRIAIDRIRIEGQECEIPRVEWEPDPVRLHADDLIGDGRGGKLEEASLWLRQELLDGPRCASELYKSAKEQGIARSTLRRAAEGLGVVTSKGGMKDGWLWSLRPAGGDAARRGGEPFSIEDV